jgi:hypothetical protein
MVRMLFDLSIAAVDTGYCTLHDDQLTAGTLGLDEHTFRHVARRCTHRRNVLGAHVARRSTHRRNVEGLEHEEHTFRFLFDDEETPRLGSAISGCSTCMFSKRALLALGRLDLGVHPDAPRAPFECPVPHARNHASLPLPDQNNRAPSALGPSDSGVTCQSWRPIPRSRVT